MPLELLATLHVWEGGRGERLLTVRTSRRNSHETKIVEYDSYFSKKGITQLSEAIESSLHEEFWMRFIFANKNTNYASAPLRNRGELVFLETWSIPSNPTQHNALTVTSNSNTPIFILAYISESRCIYQWLNVFCTRDNYRWILPWWWRWK